MGDFSQPQPQVVVDQVHQAAFAAPAANQMQEQLGNGTKQNAGGSKAAAPASEWRRVKWATNMVELLVSAVAYINEDIDAGHSSSSGMRKMGKWRLVSTAMIQRGFLVSPQQCEDKFHDLNRRYRRLTEILGRGRACEIVEKPVILEQVSLPGKLKEEAKKLLSSKHLHYEEMCCYNNHNRACLLDDPALQRMLRGIAGGSLDGKGKKCLFGYDEEEDQMLPSDDEFDEGDEFCDDQLEAEFNDDLEGEFIVDLEMEASAEDHRRQMVHGTKKLKHDHEGYGGQADEKNPNGMNAIEVERQRLKIKGKMLEIEHSHLKQLMDIKEEDKELKKMRLENEKMELGNKQLELELKLKENEMGIKPKRVY